MRRTRLITPSQLSLFSIGPVIGAWSEKLQGQKLFEGRKPAVAELNQQVFAMPLKTQNLFTRRLIFKDLTPKKPLKYQ